MVEAVNRWQRSDWIVTAPNRSKKPTRKLKAARPDETRPGTPHPVQQGRLSQRLQTLYGPIGDEPLPEDMLRLIRKH